MPKKQTIPEKKSPSKKKHALQRRIDMYMAAGRLRADRYLAARPHRTFRLTPTPRYKKGKKVGGVFSLLSGTFALIWREKRTILSLMLIFALTTYLFIGGISQLSFVDLRHTTQQLFEGNLGALGSTATLFTAAVTGSLNPNVTQLQQFLSGFLAFLYWLCLVWIVRRRMADQPTTVREAVYNSGAPVIPSVMVAMAIAFQLIPGIIGILVVMLTLNGAWFQGGVESMLVCAAGALLILLSVYWLASTVTAMIIVTLPGMTPWRSLAAASDLVIGQRWKIALRLLALTVTVLLVWAVVLIPILLLDDWLKFDWLPLIPLFVQLLGAFTLTYISVFMYKMYRSML